MSTQINIKNLIVIFLLFLSLMLLLASCGDSSITNPAANTSTTTISIKSDDNLNDNPGDTIIISEAKALVTGVEYETEGTEIENEVEKGPFVIYFDLSGAVKTISAGSIPTGNYSKMKFQIHKPEDNETPPDPEFKEGNSGNQRYSFIIKGTYNGNSFIYKSKKSLNLLITFDKTIKIQSNPLNITLLFNKQKWFKDGNNFIDPRESQFENLIDDNLKNGFKKAFKDDDKDGLSDDH